ncbi:MAG: prolipoprotein diacylglyceryl transferase [Myxococcales bacterium]|nr:prolipoprotein diacylglyceryl transferase [Myxococcales bacterium]
MPSFKWDHDPIAIHIHLPFDLKYVLFVVVALGLISAFISIREKMSPIFGLVVAGVAGYAALRWGDLQPDIPIRWYSLLFVGVFLGGYALLKWQIVRGGGDPDDAGDFIVYGVLGVLIGSRMGHVLFYDLDKAMQDPMWVLEIWTGGLASHGAVAGLILAMFIFTKRRGIAFLEGADRFAFSAALGATLVRVGNFLNSEIVGRVVPGQTWGVQFPRYDAQLVADGKEVPFRYPTQLFEVALGLLILLVLYLADRKFGKEKRPRGLLISIFFALYFPGRFLVEFWKEYQTKGDTGTLREAGLTMGQYLSIPGMLLGFYGIYWAINRHLPVGWKPREEYLEDDLDDEDLDDDELDDFDDDALDDEEDEPPPRKKARKRTGKKKIRKKSKKKTRKQVEPAAPKPSSEEDDEDEDEDEPESGRSKSAKPAETNDEQDDEDDEDEQDDRKK